MSKHKKPTSEYRLQKLNQQHHKNEFVKRLKNFGRAYCGSNATLLLTNHHIDGIYQARIHSLKLLVADGSAIEPCERKELEGFLHNRMKAELITAPDGTNISLSDYLTVGLSMYMFLNTTSKDQTSANTSFLEAVESFKQQYLTGKDANKRMYEISIGVCFLYNDLGRHSFWIDSEVRYKKKDDGAIFSYVVLHKEIPEKATFVVDNHPRPAFRVGWAWPLSGMEYLSLRPSQIGLALHGLDIPLNIYIQAHALQRLSERVDCFNPSLVHCFIMHSLKNPKVICDAQNKMLIEYTFNEYKLGYLRADIVEGSILIRTFLFLTNNGTPEGKKLEEVSGLGKLDKKYLAIDKLSSFMASDIRSDETVMQVFRKAGCEHLLELHEYLKTIFRGKKEIQHTGVLLSGYLNLKNDMEKDLRDLAV